MSSNNWRYTTTFQYSVLSRAVDAVLKSNFGSLGARTRKWCTPFKWMSYEFKEDLASMKDLRMSSYGDYVREGNLGLHSLAWQRPMKCRLNMNWSKICRFDSFKSLHHGDRLAKGTGWRGSSYISHSSLFSGPPWLRMSGSCFQPPHFSYLMIDVIARY